MFRADGLPGRIWALGLLLSAATALSACGGGTSDTSSKGSTGGSTAKESPAAVQAGGTLTWAKPAEAIELDPTASYNAVSWQIMNLVYDRLVQVDDQMKPVPAVAESWEEPSPGTYVFTLRDDVKFSNGRTLTADDVVGTLKRLVDPKSAAYWAGQLGPVKSISKTGPTEVKIVLPEPRTAFISALAADAGTAILPMKELKSGAFDPEKELLGSGPFKVVDHQQDESWTFEKNPHYWGADLPKVDKLVVRIMPEDAARVAALRDGSIDIATFDTPDAVKLLEGQQNIESVVQNTTDYYRIDVNTVTSDFKDPRLRQALSLALGGIGEPAAATPPGLEGACDPSSVPYATPDIEQAKQLVEAAGANGKTIEIIASPSFKTFPQIAQVLQQNLQEAGLKVKILQLDAGEWQKRVFADPKAPFDLALSYFGGYGDPAMVLNNWNPEAAGYNGAWLKADAKLNALIEKANSTPAGEERTQVLKDTCDAIAEQGGMIPLVTKPSIVAYRSDQIAARIQPLEGFSVPLRHIAEFGKTQG
jgi:peptide/nickel transport system substrate-binding protein